MSRLARLFATVAAFTALSAHASSFEDALKAAYDANPQIKAERERQQATDEGVAQAVSGYRPSIGASYGAARQRTSFGGAPDSDSDAITKGLRVEQPLFKGGATWSSYHSARQRQKSGLYTLSALEQRVLLDAVTAYMDVVADSAILDLSKKNENVLKEQLKATQTRFKVGEVTRTDVAQSEARLSDARSSVIASEGQLMSAMATFEHVIGNRPQGTLTVPEALPELPATLEEALAKGRAQNPELIAAVHEAKASRYDVRTNEAALLPKASLVGTLSRQTGVGTTGSGTLDQDNIGVEVTIPLYQSGSEWSRIREASAVARQRDQETIDRRLTVEQTITQRWETLSSAIATITARNEQIKAAELALDGVKQEQQYGSRTVLDVLDAERELFNARTNLVQAQRDRMVAAYGMAHALGQLTPKNLNLDVAAYDPEANGRAVRWQPLGW